MLVLSAKDEEHLRLIRLLELRSGMSCPLKVRDRVFGVITWVAGEGGRRFGAADLEFGEEIARRAAVAIDNAQLHSQVRDVALELQEAVLPAALPEPDGWTTAVRYLPAGRTDAGGDFYDLVPLDGGRLAMFVGDVMGRGVQGRLGDGPDALGDADPDRDRPATRRADERPRPGLRDPARRPAGHHGLRPGRPGARTGSRW